MRTVSRTAPRLNFSSKDSSTVLAYLQRKVTGDRILYIKARDIPGIAPTQAGKVLIFMAKAGNEDFKVEDYGATNHGIRWCISRKDKPHDDESGPGSGVHVQSVMNGVLAI